MPEWWHFFAPAKNAFPPSMAVKLVDEAQDSASVAEYRMYESDHTVQCEALIELAE